MRMWWGGGCAGGGGDGCGREGWETPGLAAGLPPRGGRGSAPAVVSVLLPGDWTGTAAACSHSIASTLPERGAAGRTAGPGSGDLPLLGELAPIKDARLR